MSTPIAHSEEVLTPERRYELDLKGYFVLKGHYDAAAVAEFHAAIDELQAIPVEYETYKKLGIASYFLAAAMEDPEHPVWKGEHRADRRPHPQTGGVGRVAHAICGTDKFDRIVRDPLLKILHQTLAGGNFYISSTYYIEKWGPARGGILHNGGYPKDRHFHYEYDHTQGRCLCSSTRSVVILRDMSTIEKGPFAAIPGSHKANFPCPYDMECAEKNPLAVSVFAEPGDVLVFTEGLTHNAFPVMDDSIRRSVFFNYSPAIDRDNLPGQRMSIYPDHVLERLADQRDILTVAGYI